MPNQSQYLRNQSNDLNALQQLEQRLLHLIFVIQNKKNLIYYRLKVSLTKWIKKHFKVACLLALSLAVLLFGIGVNVRQSLVNIDQNKSTLLDSIKKILTLNDKEQISTLNEIETKILKDLEPIANVPVIGWIVKGDIAKIKDLVALWLDTIYPFANYKLGTDGFKTTLLQERYFTGDLKQFFDKSPQLLTRTRSDLNSLWLYSAFGSSQIKEIIGLLNSFLDIIEILTVNQELVLTIFGHYQTQKIVVFNQNTGEARPTGGFIGSYIPIDIAKGEITIGQSQSIYFFDKGAITNLNAHPASWYYGWFDGVYEVHGARNANYFSCFPTSASYLEREFSRTQNGYNIDDLVLITPQFLLGYLPDNFVLEIKGDKIPKSFILSKIEQITALEIQDTLNPKKQLTSIFNLIVNQLPEVLKGQALVNLITYTQEAMLARNMQVWFRDAKIQSLWSSTGFSGEQTCAYKNPNVIAPMLVNLSVDKRNLVSVNAFEVVRNNNIINLKYTQLLPSDAGTVLARGFNSSTSMSMVAVQVPSNADVKISSDQKMLVPFLRDYYQLHLNKNRNNTDTDYIYPPEIKTIIDSSYDLNSDYREGFRYVQPDGSQVYGMYVSDQQLTQVEFQIDLKNNKSVQFIGQAGLNQPILKLKNKNYTNTLQIQSGLTID